MNIEELNEENIISDVVDAMDIVSPFVKLANISYKVFKNQIDKKIEEDYLYVIHKINENFNGYKGKDDEALKDEEFDVKRKKALSRFYKNKVYETKRLINIIHAISDKEKLEFLINIYTNFFSLQTSDEIFINALDFLEKANVYEIGFAIKLYNKESIDNDLGYIYIKKLVNYNLIDPKWGVLGGPPIDPNAYKLNEYGTNIIKALVDNKKSIK
ncbi:hypothetical protein [Peptoniphilus harei]|uniref:hypothetical protein n=1 Tax=Peptoniphilus harei TaxID=54005 RepID=UPI0029099320|nr:hypothetical protein [Peptoniphilus harei]MDU5417011.1 hypothetical protein [Peptoniphilus harei]